jgi:hypothetical protein
MENKSDFDIFGYSVTIPDFAKPGWISSPDLTRSAIG